MQHVTADNLAHLAWCLTRIVRCRTGTGFACLMARWWRIDMGEGCRFYGRPQFRRAAGSRIAIGRRCTFRSTAWASAAGIARPCSLATFSDGASLRIEDDCGFSGTVIVAAESVSIGVGTMCGANTSIQDTDWHAISSESGGAGGGGATAPVVIGPNVWLGAGVIVLKGTEIGHSTVVGAGSIVTRSLPPGVVAVGAPAKPVRDLNEL